MKYNRSVYSKNPYAEEVQKQLVADYNILEIPEEDDGVHSICGGCYDDHDLYAYQSYSDTDAEEEGVEVDSAVSEYNPKPGMRMLPLPYKPYFVSESDPKKAKQIEQVVNFQYLHYGDWEKPRDGWFLVDTHGNKKGRYAAILRDQYGRAIAAAAGSSLIPGTQVRCYQLEGVLKGLQLVKKYLPPFDGAKVRVNTESIIVESLVCRLASLPEDLKQWKPILEEVQTMMGSISGLIMSRTCKSSNGAARWLARYWKDANVVMLPNEFPDELKAIVELDGR